MLKGQHHWVGYWCCCVCMDVITNMGFLCCKFALSTRFCISLLLIPFLTWGSILYWIFFFNISIVTLCFFFFFFCEGWIGIIHMHFSSCTFFLSPLMCNMGKYSYVWFLKPVKPLKFSTLLCAVRFPFKKELDFNFHMIEVHLAICLFWSYWSWWSCKSSFLWEIEMTSFNLGSFLC